jgi:gliding motility-associated-like protein
MNRFNYILLFLLFISINAFGTHNRAGEITYRHISGYTFELTITTYTYRYSPANRIALTVTWGDGTSSVINKVPPGQKWIVIPGTDYYFNTYIGTHTYPGAGVYEILMEDPNRNQGVKNIPNSVNTIFSIKTTMLIGSDIGSNNTPVLLNPPIDKAAKGHIFIHNPAAYDSDGDSLSYSITVCTGEGGQPIEGYVLPPATDTLLIDEITGDLKWITPAEVGVYNIAILVEEWRKNIHIGRIERDMQINVYESDDNPPVNQEIPDYCIEAGDTIDFSITTTDADNDQVKQEMEGGPFQVTNPAVFEIESVGYGWAISHFRWITNCSHARQQPYYLVLKSADINDDISLVDITSFYIRVLHKAPDNLRTFAGVDTIKLEWDASHCGNPAGYKIYRRLGYYGFSPDSCENGVPEYTGYELIDIVAGGNVNSYRDDDHGEGLVPGYDYCYMITAYYSDGAESFASHEVCTTLIAGTPPILKVSVNADDEVNGEIDLAWAVPLGVDTIDDGPYRYEILRMDPGQANFTSIATKPTTDLRDTTYIDADINFNTLIFPYTYSVILYYYEGGAWYKIPGNETATSQYITIDGADNELTLNMKKRAPWLNYRYDIYRKNNNTNIFNFIGSSNRPVYIDTALRNNTTYTYRTVGFGTRPLFGTEYPAENISHIAKGMPIDTIPPCTPDLFVTSECDSTVGYNYLTWNISDSCKNDEVLGYKIYFRNSLEGNFALVDSLPPDRRSYKHFADSTIEGCYAITAIDSSNNESLKIPFCVYNLCSFYNLPNVFTPDGDGINDIYKSFNLNGYIKKVGMTIFNRYGKAVFKTDNADINWDGRNKENGKLVSTGVYYYICDVYEPRITGIVVHNLTGFIHIFSGGDNNKAE